jgi:PAS domain S-box-containing protein
VTAAADPGTGTLQAARRLLWLLAVPVLLLLGVLTALEYVQRMQDAERDLLRRAEERAQELESTVRPAMAHVQDLRTLLEQRWHEPPDSGPALRHALRPHIAGGQPDGWSLDAADAATREHFGQVWWADPAGREPEAAWLKRAQMFVEQARIVHRRAPGFEATWFAAAEENTSFGYPWVDTDRMLRSMGEPSLRALDAVRRSAAQRSIDALKRDPNDITFWGAPYVSQLDGQLVMSHGAMVVVDGAYRGEVSLDFRLDELQRRIAQWAGPKAGPGAPGRVWIVDTRYNVLADSAAPLPAPANAAANTPVQVRLADRLPAGVSGADLDATLFGPARVHHGDGWVLTAAVRIGSPWLYVQATPASALRAGVLPTLLPNLVLALALLGMFIAGQRMLAEKFVRPALTILTYLRGLSADAETAAPQLGRRWQGWIDAVTDTFRRQRELQQRERQTEALKASIIDHAIAGIVSIDMSGRIVEFNPAAEAMFGVRRAEAIGRQAADVIIPERFREANRRELARVGSGEAPRGMGQRLQQQMLRAGGSEFPVELVVFRTDLGGVPHFTAWMVDITERVEAAGQIERQRDALRQSEKLTAMGSLLAGVAHELNNPLAIVMGRASLLAEKTEGTPLAADAERIREAADRCGRIVRTFLNMARQRPVQRAPVQMNDLARAAAEMLGYTLRSHGIEIELALTEGLPEVMADGDRVGQVLLNLIVNAQQALVDAEAPRRIKLSTGVEDRRDNREPRVWLRVADTGPGVPPAVRAKIFEPFFTTKAEGIGTGLGLSVSRSMVREHGGDLMLEKSERGAAFRLSLPISGEARDSTASMPLDEVLPARDARILVVDDEPEITELVRSMLESAGWEVATAESGAVALELLGEARFDAIVSDLRMPDMDGAAFWRAVRERAPALARRTLFVTGDTLSPEAQQFLGKARCPSLDKPFAKSDLLAAVQELLEA